MPFVRDVIFIHKMCSILWHSTSQNEILKCQIKLNHNKNKKVHVAN